VRARVWSIPLSALLGIGALVAFWRREPPLPGDLAGTIVYVSDRDGIESLYARRLPDGSERRLTFLNEPVRDPAVSPDGKTVAFSMAGRIGLISLRTGDIRILTLGIDWHDASPSWRPDGAALVVVSRRSGEANADVHLLTTLDAAAGQVERRPITLTGALDETAPVLGPGGAFVVFVRQDNLVRMDLGAGRTRRLTGGFRKMREPRFLPSGRLLALWSQDKRFGIEVMDADGKNKETLVQGSTFYRTVAPSPDGRFFAATYTFDLGFHPTEALKLRQTEEVRLLDGQGRAVATLARSWRHSSHSPEWAR